MSYTFHAERMPLSLYNIHNNIQKPHIPILMFLIVKFYQTVLQSHNKCSVQNWQYFYCDVMCFHGHCKLY